MSDSHDPAEGSFREIRERSIPVVARAAETVLRELRNPRTTVAAELESYVRMHPELGSGDRSLLFDLTYAYVRWKRRLMLALSKGGWRGRAPEASACALLLEYTGVPRDVVMEVIPTTADLDTGAAVEAFRGLDPARAADAVELASRASLPEWIVARIVEQYGFERAREMAVALRQRAPTMLRANTLKATRDEAMERIRGAGARCRESDYSPWGIELVDDDDLTGSTLVRDGLIEPQDEASQLAVLLCSVAPGMIVIDACAGAGGKSLALAAVMRNEGSLIAADIDDRRLKEAERRARRAGVEIMRIARLGGDGYPPELERAADVVFVDVPCTGSGTWRRVPDGHDRLRQSDLQRYQRRQGEILERASGLVKPGGRLVYATCSIFAAENQGVVNPWREKHPEFVTVPAREALEAAAPAEFFDGPYFAVTPERAGMDGFFAAAFTRSG